MAEKEGFEPSRRYKRPTPFPGEPLRPLGYFSMWLLPFKLFWLTQRLGFEPREVLPSPVFKTGALNQLDHLCTVCPRPESNRYEGLARRILSPVRLPVPPLGQISLKTYCLFIILCFSTYVNYFYKKSQKTLTELVGFEPTKCWSQNPVPYHLAIAH